MMWLRRIVAMAILSLMGVFSAAQAWPIAYALTGNVYGSIGATPLNGETFTWILFGDTNSTISSPPFISVPETSELLQISGPGGTGGVTVLNPFQFSVDPATGQAAFTDSSFASGVTISDPAFVGYDATTNILPRPVNLVTTGDVMTSHGLLVMNDFSNLDFEALLAIPAVVPEPITLALFVAGLAGIGALRRRKA